VRHAAPRRLLAIAQRRVEKVNAILGHTGSLPQSNLRASTAVNGLNANLCFVLLQFRKG
jgi:hypothetical protein